MSHEMISIAPDDDVIVRLLCAINLLSAHMQVLACDTKTKINEAKSDDAKEAAFFVKAEL